MNLQPHPRDIVSIPTHPHASWPHPQPIPMTNVPIPTNIVPIPIPITQNFIHRIEIGSYIKEIIIVSKYTQNLLNIKSNLMS